MVEKAYFKTRQFLFENSQKIVDFQWRLVIFLTKEVQISFPLLKGIKG